MEENDNEIYEESGNRDSDFLDGDDDPTYVPSNLNSHYSDTEARIQSLYLTDSGLEREEEDKDHLQIPQASADGLPATTDPSSTPSDTRALTAKDGSF